MLSDISQMEKEQKSYDFTPSGMESKQIKKQNMTKPLSDTDSRMGLPEEKGGRGEPQE